MARIFSNETSIHATNFSSPLSSYIGVDAVTHSSPVSEDGYGSLSTQRFSRTAV